MASDSLYMALAEALSKPSKNYQAAQAGLAIPEQALKGYQEGAQFSDSIRKRKLGQRTLNEALGGNLPAGTEGYGNLTEEEFKPTAELLTGLGAIQKANAKASAPDFATKFKMQQDAINNRQKEHEDFIRSMVDSKGNPGAVNQAKNALDGLGFVDELSNRLDKLSPVQRTLASAPLTEKMYPELNTLKKNIRRTAGFAEGGKNLTENELDIVVQSFEPTAFDNSESRALKKRIAKDYYSGTIDLYDAANLLGPAGAKLKDIAEKRKRRDAVGRSLLAQDAAGGGGEGSDLNSLFESEGL